MHEYSNDFQTQIMVFLLCTTYSIRLILFPQDKFPNYINCGVVVNIFLPDHYALITHTWVHNRVKNINLAPDFLIYQTLQINAIC